MTTGLSMYRTVPPDISSDTFAPEQGRCSAVTNSGRRSFECRLSRNLWYSAFRLRYMSNRGSIAVRWRIGRQFETVLLANHLHQISICNQHLHLIPQISIGPRVTIKNNWNWFGLVSNKDNVTCKILSLGPVATSLLWTLISGAHSNSLLTMSLCWQCLTGNPSITSSNWACRRQRPVSPALRQELKCIVTQNQMRPTWACACCLDPVSVGCSKRPITENSNKITSHLWKASQILVVTTINDVGNSTATQSFGQNRKCAYAWNNTLLRILETLFAWICKLNNE